MEPENYVGRCPHCGVITAAVRMPLKAKEVDRFGEDMAKAGCVLSMATNAEVKASSWEHASGCPRQTPKVAKQLKLEDWR